MTPWHITTTAGVRLAVIVEPTRGRFHARTSGFATLELRCVGSTAERAVARLVCALALDHDVCVRGIERPGDDAPDVLAQATQVDALHREDATTTTVVARIAALGFAHSNHLAWVAGAAAQRAWRRRCGRQPVKANTTKGRGHGAHCHARYPLSWRDELDAIVRACANDAPTQGVLALVTHGQREA